MEISVGILEAGATTLATLRANLAALHKAAAPFSSPLAISAWALSRAMPAHRAAAVSKIPDAP